MLLQHSVCISDPAALRHHKHGRRIGVYLFLYVYFQLIAYFVCIVWM
jgi:hypothetical protein